MGHLKNNNMLLIRMVQENKCIDMEDTKCTTVYEEQCKSGTEKKCSTVYDTVTKRFFRAYDGYSSFLFSLASYPIFFPGYGTTVFSNKRAEV